MFHVVGHGIPPAELARFADAMRRLFELPAETKHALRRTRDNAWGWYDAELTKNRRDWKEVFDYGVERAPGTPAPSHSDGVNRWPAARPELREALLAHYHRCGEISRGLLHALCAGLGLAPDSLDAAFTEHTSFQRLNRYLPCPDPAPADASLLRTAASSRSITTPTRARSRCSGRTSTRASRCSAAKSSCWSSPCRTRSR